MNVREIAPHTPAAESFPRSEAEGHGTAEGHITGLIEAIATDIASRVAELTPSAPPAIEQPAKLALNKPEAAEMLSMSVDSLERHVLPEIRTIRKGRLTLVPLAELRTWIDRSAARALEDRR